VQTPLQHAAQIRLLAVCSQSGCSPFGLSSFPDSPVGVSCRVICFALSIVAAAMNTHDEAGREPAQ